MQGFLPRIAATSALSSAAISAAMRLPSISSIPSPELQAFDHDHDVRRARDGLDGHRGRDVVAGILVDLVSEEEFSDIQIGRARARCVVELPDRQSGLE